MKHYLSLTEPHNKLTAEIAEVIKHYYPIGISHDSEEYKKHPGIAEIKAKMDEHFIDTEAWKPWGAFLTYLQDEYNSQITNSGLLLEMSYGGELTLQRYEDEFMIREKIIRFSISRLASFYTIYRVDETVIKDNDEKTGRGKYYRAINVITTSPYQEFEGVFNYLRTSIETQYIGYKFMPFWYCSYLVPDVILPFTSWSETTVYNAIFSGSLNQFHLPSIKLRGDQFYGILR